MIFFYIFSTVVLLVTASGTAGASRGFDEAERLREPRGASFCYEDISDNGCWENRPTNLPNCTLEHAVTAPNENCFFTELNDNGANFESEDPNDTNFSAAKCQQKSYYVLGGLGDGLQYESIVCERFEIHDQWNELGKIGTTETTCTNHWWEAACCFTKPGFSFHDGVCSGKDKYLGEECGDEWGICKNDKDDEYMYHLACYQKEGTSTKPTCNARIFDVVEKKECACSALTLVICSSDDCNGHACVQSFSDFKHYCDWFSGNNW